MQALLVHYGHVRRYGFSAHDAQDLSPGFFLDLPEHNALTRANQQKGKFRPFLLAPPQNFLSNEAHKARCTKNRLRQEYVDKRKTSTFEALQGFLDPVNPKNVASYEEVAKQLKVS